MDILLEFLKAPSLCVNYGNNLMYMFKLARITLNLVHKLIIIMIIDR